MSYCKETLGMLSKNLSVLSLAQQLIMIPSVTPVEEKNYPYAVQTLDYLQNLALDSGGVVQHFPSEGGHPKWTYKVDNLYAEWRYGTPNKRIIFMGHTDVVPEGNEQAWSQPAFAGEVKDGYLYGRGATDMKGAVAAFYSAIQQASPDLNNIAVGMLITTDEEWAAVNGSRHVLQSLQAQNLSVDAVIVGEPSSQDILGTHIKLGRRGSLVGYLDSQGVQGHAAYQDSFINANRGLNLAMTVLQDTRWADGNDFMPATNFEPIAAQSGDFNASAIIPGQARMMWNIRFTPHQTPDGLVTTLQNALAQPPEWVKQHRDFELLKNIEVKANINSVSLPYMNDAGRLAQVAQQAVENVTGITSQFDSAGGTTDGRFVHAYFPQAEIIELGPPERGGLLPDGTRPSDYLQQGGMHQVNERIAIKDLHRLTQIYADTLHRYSL
jgi:succinyl-diaminopimelate desuccinylase